ERMNREQLQEIVQQGHHLKPDAEIRLPRQDEATVSFYIDLVKYGITHEIKRWLDADFSTAFAALPFEEKIRLAKCDSHLVLPAAVLAELYHTDYLAYANAQDPMVQDLFLALAIVDKRLDLINND